MAGPSAVCPYTLTWVNGATTYSDCMSSGQQIPVGKEMSAQVATGRSPSPPKTKPATRPSPAPFTTKIDTVKPVGTIVIGSATAPGPAYTNTEAVTLYLTASESAKVAFSKDNVSYTSYTTFVAQTNSFPLDLTTQFGSRTVYLRLQDDAGNVSDAVSDSIYLDKVKPPAVTSLSIGGASTGNPRPHLDLAAHQRRRVGRSHQQPL